VGEAAPERTRARLAPALAGLAACACGRLQSLPAQPPQTPESFLASQPFVEIGIASRRLVLVQPTSTALVCLLGLVALAAGLRFLRTRGAQRSRLWWGLGLVLWALGTFLAGTSYQAFGYELKCAGRATCAFTSGWEVGYLVVAAWSLDALAVAHAHACAAGARRRRLTACAAVHAAVYSAVVLAGALVPVRALVSFELLVVAVAPWVALFTVTTVRRYLATHDAMAGALAAAWLCLGLVTAAYYAYLVAGIGPELWTRGVWFSENDVLHAGLVAWMLLVALRVAPRVRDEAGQAASAQPSGAAGPR
jgi:hypothetical protein